MPFKNINLSKQNKSFVNTSILKDSNYETDEITFTLKNLINTNKSTLDAKLKRDILKQLNKTISSNNTSFNDHNVIESVFENSKEKIKTEDKMNISTTNNFVTPNAHQIKDHNVIESVFENSKEKIKTEDKMNISTIKNFVTPNTHQINECKEDDNDHLTTENDVNKTVSYPQNKSLINTSILKDSNYETFEIPSKLEKDDTLKQYNQTISSNNTSFNHHNVIESELENSKEKIEAEEKMNILMTNFLTPNAHQNNDDREDDSDYLKAESELETFIKENGKIFNEFKQDMLNARRQQAKFYVSTRRGILIEKFVIENFNKENNLNFVQDKQLKIADFKDFKICGKIDGIDREKRIIIEIKTRNTINGKVNIKERKQALTYMKLMDCDQCWIVERGPNSDEQNVIVIKWDEEEFENEIINKLKMFCEHARSLNEKQFLDLHKRFTKY